MAALIPEIFKSIQVRLRQIRDQYVARSGPNEVFELEELARESYDAISRVNKNLLRMIEIERSLNAANKLTGSSQMRMCRQLVREIADLSGVEIAPMRSAKKQETAADMPVMKSQSISVAGATPNVLIDPQTTSADFPQSGDNAAYPRDVSEASTDSGSQRHADKDENDSSKHYPS